MKSNCGTNLIITGLPRSGTSYLCARVNEFPNTVVVNEPAEIFPKVKGGDTDGLAQIFSQYRHDISEGNPIYNKIKDGKFIEDTRLVDSRSLHHHIVENEQFMLGIKNTLVFMSMLPEICRSKAFQKTIATIRHPYDCIASWHSVEFPHLKQARPDYLLAYAEEKFATRLAVLLSEEEPILRSAMLWGLLAQTLLAAKGKIHLMRYEDMVTKPEKTYQRMSGYLEVATGSIRPPQPSKPVRRRDAFNSAQKNTIASICNKYAVQFGYRMK